MCADVYICSCYRIALSATFMPSNTISIKITCTGAWKEDVNLLQLVQLPLCSSDDFKRQKLCSTSRHIAAMHGAQKLPGASLRPLLPSSSCLGSSHPLDFCTFYFPEQTRSRSRCTTVNSGARTWGRSIQQCVFAVLSLLRQGDGLPHQCHGMTARGKTGGWKRDLAFQFHFSFCTMWQRWSVTLQCHCFLHIIWMLIFQVTFFKEGETMEIPHSPETTFRKGKAKSFVFSRQLIHSLLHGFSAFWGKLLGLAVLLCLQLPCLMPSLSCAMTNFNPPTMVLGKGKQFLLPLAFSAGKNSQSKDGNAGLGWTALTLTAEWRESH